jgi:hypothetical protein
MYKNRSKKKKGRERRKWESRKKVINETHRKIEIKKKKKKREKNNTKHTRMNQFFVRLKKRRGKERKGQKKGLKKKRCKNRAHTQTCKYAYKVQTHPHT